MMELTFEERIAEKLDGLYQGCLFLEGGDEVAAEHLLISCATRGFRQSAAPRGEGDFQTWLDGVLVTAFSECSPPRRTRTSRDETSLFTAAAQVPREDRAALWLVFLRRWPYRDAAEVLGTSRERLREMLESRRTLMDSLRQAGLDARHGTGS